jgi:hypothetical protein
MRERRSRVIPVATLGHMAANIHVVDLRTGGKPTFLRALARSWLKAFAGLLAFAFMGTTRRHQALHDLAARTTVEITDPAKALPQHFVEERAPIRQRACRRGGGESS